MPLYPLRFEPAFRRYLWGGRRLATVLGKALPQGKDYAESWEIVDHGPDQSRVAFGALAGTSLHAVITQHGDALFGQHAPQSQFPLLFKFLDACQDLSLQVHPNDEQAKSLPQPDLGKTEAWVVLEAEPGSVLYAGLKSGIGREDLLQHVLQGTLVEAMHVVQPQVGDCIFIPAGVVHAIGRGLLVAEIQQASDTTFRLFDWGRVGPDGQPRATHVAEALDVADYCKGPVSPQVPRLGPIPGRELLVACDKFVLERWTLRGDVILPSRNRFHVLAVIRGEVALEGDPAEQSLRVGETALIPAACPSVRISPRGESVVLVISLP